MKESEILTSSLMGDMPTELLQFIKDRVTSFVKFDLIRFFHENQYTYDTAENIAYYSGHDEEPIENALEGLVADNILEITIADGVHYYSLIKDGQMRGLIGQFVEACEDASFRTKVIFHIIRRMR
jgi:hypothetical protein